VKNLGLLVTLLCVIFSGCAAQKIVLPSASNLPDSDAAIFVIDKSSKRASMQPFLNAIYTSDGRALVESKSFKDYDRIKVAPDLYTVQLKIYEYNTIPSFPWVKVKAEAGQTYVFFSSNIMDGKAVKADFTAVPTASYQAPK